MYGRLKLLGSLSLFVPKPSFLLISASLILIPHRPGETYPSISQHGLFGQHCLTHYTHTVYMQTDTPVPPHILSLCVIEHLLFARHYSNGFESTSSFDFLFSHEKKQRHLPEEVLKPGLELRASEATMVLCEPDCAWEMSGTCRWDMPTVKIQSTLGTSSISP